MIEHLVGLEIINDRLYKEYRKHMKPILHEMGGGFGYDFTVDQVLKSESKNKINRVFTIYFPSQDIMDQFFSHKKYNEIKEKYFTPAVASTTYIAQYHTSK